ncbi:MAG TPA: AraC family transcriptional regulator ligand-binding domain-containing protein [Caulobacteraceae bacterium]|jgi:AraC-like DNA-binding protein
MTKQNPTPAIRAGSLAHFETTARRVGLDPAVLLRSEGLDLDALRNPDGRLPAAAVASLLEAAAAEAGQPDFGLRLAELWSLADLGPISLSVAHQDTLREALGALDRRRVEFSDAVALGLHETARSAELRVRLVLPGGVASAQLADFVLGKTVKLCRAMLGPAWLPLGARFRRFEPRELSTYRRLLGSDALVFGAAGDALLLRPGDLDVRAPRMPDPALRRHAEALIANLPSIGAGSIAQRAGSLIRAGLSDGTADLNHVARALGLNGRTLQRRLKAEGLGFSELLDQVRGELARAYLADRQTPMHQIATRLGYADGSAFTRWFTQAFGAAPSRWRETAEAGAEQPAQLQSA